MKKQKPNFITYRAPIYERGKEPLFGLSGIAKPGKTSKGMRAAAEKAGVYIITEDGKPVYVGNSRSDLRKTIMRHFQNWKDTGYRTNYRVDKKRYRIEITVVRNRNERQIFALEQALIDRLKPRDNTNGVYGPYNNKYRAPDNDKEACVDCYKEAKESATFVAQQIESDEIPF